MGASGCYCLGMNSATTTPEMATWMNTIARFAAPHVARGVSVDDAIKAGMADYQGTLASMSDPNRGTLSEKGEAFAKQVASNVWHAVNGK